MVVLRQSLEDELGIDPVALVEKYRVERDRRLRPEALGQYVDLDGDLSHYRDDPWVDADFTREHLNDEVDVLVIGGGLGGILHGVHLRKAGVANIRVIERGGDFGGVWYWNRYPGAACDTQAMLYLPMLEEMGYVPSHRFASGPEIRAYLQSIARKYDLYRDAHFQTEVTGLCWDEGEGRWTVSTNRGDAIRARYVTIALGPMERPKLAGIPGLQRFAGHSFHTSRWDYAYTGGGPEGGLDGLHNKTVGIIGTGATAVQCVPHLADSARHLYVFQRTPSSIDVRDNRPLDPEEFDGLEPGWQERLWHNFTTIVSGIYTDDDQIRDGWTSMMAIMRSLAVRKAERGEPVENPMTLAQIADYVKMEGIRDRVSHVVEDPSVAALLKPWYNRFCKRPCFSDEYLPAFNRANVTLVDTSEGRGVERITERGVVVDGREYPLDCLIYSTGFDVGTPFVKRIGYEIAGRDGVLLSAKWADGAATLHGIASHGFPNLFLMSVVQTGVSMNFTHMINEQARHIAYIVARAVGEEIDIVEVSRHAEEQWCAEIDRTALDQEAFLRACTPSYFNYEGDLKRRNVRNNQYGGGPIPFYRIIADWREEGTMPGLELTHRSKSPPAVGGDAASPQIPS
ncbi:flavin-containing monooxygenase [Sphingobium tyrosinilyticum]|uniref:Flavin-containing monooxygenase n=2 Tax=Sphingobium tyrosinilyticum TaxID=2715436 RepID=A0ABV9F2W8_9SPHN